MLTKIKLFKIYNRMKEEFPNLKHDEDKYFIHLIAVLNRDPLRNRGLLNQLKEKKLEFEILRDWPLNGFLYACREYLKERKIKDKEIKQFEDNLIYINSIWNE